MGLFRGVELADLTLSGPRLDLRRWRAQDAARVHEAMQDPSMREFLALPDPYTADTAADYAGRSGQAGRDAGTSLGCAMVERATGRVVGSAELRLAGNPDIGYWVAGDTRGRGYAAEATRLLADWALRLGVPRIELQCDVGNPASIRTAQTAGFGYEGIARSAHQGGGARGVPARYGDDAIFARTAQDDGAPIPPAFPALPEGRLTDGVLALRPMRPDDAAAFHETEDELSVRWGFDAAGRPLADTTRAAERSGLLWLVGGEARFAMEDVATGLFAGELQLRRSGPPQIGSLGYVVHPRFRGRGYTTRALRLVTPWAFDAAGFARLELGAKRDNVASQRAARAAGFTQECVHAGRLRNPDGTFSDEIGFALLDPRHTAGPSGPSPQ